jgi:hypothetical protein
MNLTWYFELLFFQEVVPYWLSSIICLGIIEFVLDLSSKLKKISSILGITSTAKYFWKLIRTGWKWLGTFCRKCCPKARLRQVNSKVELNYHSHSANKINLRSILAPNYKKLSVIKFFA